MSASIFEERLRATVALARKAAGQAVGAKPDVPPKDLTPDDTDWTDQEVLLHITGEKSLPDPEEQATILGVFEDTFYDTLEEWEDD